MKISIAITLLPVLLSMACGQASNLDETIAAARSAISSNEQAANQVYLDDVTDSAADDPEAETAPADNDTSVEVDTKSDRLDQMVALVFGELDTDASGSLSLAEFLVGPKKRAAETELDAIAKAKITTQMTLDFNTYAGADALMTSAELKILLKAVGPRVHSHRKGKGEGHHDERVRQTAAEVIAKFDTDGDGKLNEAEFTALQASHKAEVKVWQEINHEGEPTGRPVRRGPPVPAHG